MSMTEAEFLSQYMLPDDERKRLLLGNVLLGIGGGLMSGKRGNEIGALGSGAVVGAQMGQQAISDAQRGQVDKLKLRQTWQEGEDKRRAQEASQQVTADISRLFVPQNPTENMPSRAPTVDNAANIPAKRQKWEIYLEAAEKAALGRDMVAAKHWAELAEKHKPKFSTTPHVGLKDGKAGNYVLDDMGNEKPLGFAPPPEFLTFDDGKTKQVRNKYLMPESGMDIAMQTTPGDDQRAALQRAQMAQSERHWQAGPSGAGGGKPQLVNGQWVFPPDAQNPTGRAVTPAGMETKAEKPSDEQLKTGGFVERMQFADKYISAIESDTLKPGTNVVAKEGYRPGAGEGMVQGLGGVPLVGGVLGKAGALTQAWVEPRAAAYKNVKKAWIRAKLRKESGAVIGAEEEADEDRTFFPQPGDPVEVVKQKAALRKNVEQSMARQARGGYQGGAVQDDPLGLRR